MLGAARVVARLRRVAVRRAVRWAVACAVALYAAWLALDLTPATWWVDEARFARPADAFDVVDRNGVVLRHARVDGVDRRWIELRDVDPVLIDAFIAAEDARFRSHDGVDALALLRAAATSVRPWGRKSGGSTISQQVVKLVYGRTHRVLDKPLEVLRARALERMFTKDQILEQYVNRVPFGDRIQGVARASEEYFGHGAGDLTLAEAAMLAGIPQAPSANEPRRHLDRTKRRAAYVLRRMRECGMIDAETGADPESALAGRGVRDIPARPNHAPRFVDAALARWRSGALDRQGGDLQTSLDDGLQREVDGLLGDATGGLRARGVTNGAAVVVANATGEILAYTAAAQREAGGSLDLLARRRQPGSTLKPFAYELFFERGGTAATVLDDISVSRTGAERASYEAKDYDGRERGPVRARVALASSLNLAALDVAARVGQDALVDRLRDLGFRGIGAASRYGGAAVLGGIDVAPIDLASAYVTLARGGTEVPLAWAPVAAAGHPSQARRIMSAAAAEITRDVLSDPQARAAGFGADLVDRAGGRFALKTGTSSGYRDAWAAVFDDTFTVVVWMGDPEGRPLAGVSGFEASAPVAARILGIARQRKPSGVAPIARPEPSPLISLAVCAETGLRVGAGCTHVVQERFADDALPTATCEAHDEHGDVILPARYADWVQRHHPSGVAPTFLDAAAEEDPVVHDPRDGARLLIDPTRGATIIPLHARAGRTDIGDATWTVDDVELSGASWQLTPGRHEIVAKWRGKKSVPSVVRVEAAR